jgi:polyhydroxybutyrate depolymerase
VGDGTMEVMPTSEKTSFESSVEHYSYSNTEGVVMVEHYKVIGGGHEWLNSINVQGDANWDINTIETILNFFDRFDINGMRE